MKIKKYAAIFYKSKDDRTSTIKKNIALSFVNKFFSIAISLLIVPLTLKYIDAKQYGIWLALSSIVGWMSFLDFGVTHGLRNKFAEALALNKQLLAKQYVSTSYVILSVFFVIIGVIASFINKNINWSAILNLPSELNPSLVNVFYVLIISFCVQLVLNILTTIITADQKPAFAAFINTLGQFFVLCTIILLLLTTKGSLLKLSFAISVMPCIIYFIASIYLFSHMYREYAPKIKHININLIKDIVGLGGKFFVIQLSIIFVFQMMNIVIIRVLGAEEVAIYNIAYKYFSIVYMLTVIFITPLWSAFTDAYTKKDFDWMKNIYFKMSRLWFLFVPLILFMLLVSPYVYKVWVGNDIYIPFNYSLGIAIYILILSRSNLSMYLINGTSKITIQLIIYVIFAVISIPLMFYFSKIFGLIGILIVVSVESFMQIVFGEIQIRKIISNKATGIWNI